MYIYFATKTNIYILQQYYNVLSILVIILGPGFCINDFFIKIIYFKFDE